MVQIGPEKVREWFENGPRVVRDGLRWPENGSEACWSKACQYLAHRRPSETMRHTQECRGLSKYPPNLLGVSEMNLIGSST